MYRLLGEYGLVQRNATMPSTDVAAQASYFCYPCALAQMETEVKDRAKVAHHGGKAEGYSQPQGGMSYQQPGNQQPDHSGQTNGHMAYQQGPPKY